MRQYKIFISFTFSAILFFTGLFFVGTASAQEVAGGGSYLIRMTPELPGPSQEVTAEVVSNAISINTAPIKWVLNGKTALQGVGKKKFTFTTGTVGLTTILRVEVDTVDFGVVVKTINIQPSDVDILWEANTYTPPFYKGKALPTSQSYIKAVAIPNFMAKTVSVRPENLVYRWKKTYTANPDDSGLGRNVFLYRGNYSLNDDTIETVVSTEDGGLSVNKETVIPIYEPLIVFYENKPLEGTRYENTLGDDFVMKQKEITVRAEPYFFSFLRANDNGAEFVWRLDGKKLEVSPGKKSEFTLQKPEKGDGSNNISLEIKNNGYDLQLGTRNIALSYTN